MDKEMKDLFLLYGIEPIGESIIQYNEQLKEYKKELDEFYKIENIHVDEETKAHILDTISKFFEIKTVDVIKIPLALVINTLVNKALSDSFIKTFISEYVGIVSDNIVDKIISISRQNYLNYPELINKVSTDEITLKDYYIGILLADSANAEEELATTNKLLKMLEECMKLIRFGSLVYNETLYDFCSLMDNILLKKKVQLELKQGIRKKEHIHLRLKEKEKEDKEEIKSESYAIIQKNKKLFKNKITDQKELLIIEKFFNYMFRKVKKYIKK